MRELIFTGIPDDYTREKYILFSIANFQTAEDKYTIYKNDIAVASSASVEDNIKIGNATSEYALSRVKDYTSKLNEHYQTSYSEQFWLYIVYPWLVTVVQLLYDRQAMVLKFIDKFKYENIQIKLLDENTDINVNSTITLAAYLQMNPDFNHWIYSRIIEANCPDNWSLSYVKSDLSDFHLNKPDTISLKQRLNNIFKLAEYKINQNVSNVYGTTIIERILLSILVKLKPPINSRKHPGLAEESLTSGEIEWSINPDMILEKLIPDSILNLKLKHKKTGKGKIKIFSNDLYYNTRSQLNAAFAKINNGVVIPAQHGGYMYGMGYVNSVIGTIEVKQDYFISWGWDSHKDSRVIPLPSPLLSKIMNKHQARNKSMILVSSVGNYYSSRYNSWLPPDQIFEYRNERENFILSLSQLPLDHLKYKPYRSRAYAIRDSEYFANHYPSLQRLDGNLNREMLSCRLLILDHPGTALALAMAANTPTILFFKPELFSQIDDVKELFNKFKQANIYHPSSKSAAEFVNDTYSNIETWWNSRLVQDVRTEFMNKYALADTNWLAIWMRSIWNLQKTR